MLCRYADAGAVAAFDHRSRAFVSRRCLYAAEKRSGLLIPGGILLVTGGLLWFETLTDWTYATMTSPVYLFAVAFGLFEAWLFGRRQRGLFDCCGGSVRRGHFRHIHQCK